MDTKEKILDAAIDVFSENGYYKTSMDSIAVKAEVSKGALYYFYKNKAELFYEAAHMGIELLGTELQKCIHDAPDTQTTICRVIETYVTLCMEYPRVALLILNGGAEQEDELGGKQKELLESVHRQLMDILQDNCRYLSVTNPDLTASALTGMLNGVCVRQIRYGFPYPKEEVVQLLCRMVAGGIL